MVSCNDWPLFAEPIYRRTHPFQFKEIQLGEEFTY
jgi:hypothetical protein